MAKNKIQSNMYSPKSKKSSGRAFKLKNKHTSIKKYASQGK